MEFQEGHIYHMEPGAPKPEWGNESVWVAGGLLLHPTYGGQGAREFDLVCSVRESPGNYHIFYPQPRMDNEWLAWSGASFGRHLYKVTEITPMVLPLYITFEFKSSLWEKLLV